MRGDSGWNIGISLNSSGITQYVQDRIARGFNTTLLYMAPVGPDGSTAANLNGDQPFLKATDGSTYTNRSQLADFSTWNTAYFDQWDLAINTCATYGMMVLLFPAYLGFNGGNQGWYTDLQANSGAKRTAYGNFFGSRYTSFPNIIYVMGGDYNPADTSSTIAIATAIVAADSTHLMTAHCADGTNASTEWGGQSWLTVDSVYTDVQNGHPWIHTNMQSSYTGQSRPSFMIESCYEFDNSGTEQLIRQENWESLLNGGMGYTFGSGGSVAPKPLWEFLTSWPTLLGTTGALGSNVVNNLMASRAWWLLVPDTGFTFLTNGGSYSGAAFASAAQASDGSCGAIYVPTNESLTVALSGFTRRVGAFWMDPTSGSVQSAVNGTLGTSGSHTFAATPGTNAAGDNDWVLLFEAPNNCVFYADS